MRCSGSLWSTKIMRCGGGSESVFFEITPKSIPFPSTTGKSSDGERKIRVRKSRKRSSGESTSVPATDISANSTGIENFSLRVTVAESKSVRKTETPRSFAAATTPPGTSSVPVITKRRTPLSMTFHKISVRLPTMTTRFLFSRTGICSSKLSARIAAT